jgi:hypothetical protein
MKGHLKERSPGHWAIILDQRDPATGERKRKWHSFEGTKRAAQAECARLITEIKSGVYVQPSRITLAAFFDRWLTHIKPNVAPRTYERYEQIATKNIAPLLGAKLITALRPIDISGAYAKALESGRCNGPGGLSPRTVNHMHRVLYSALDQAERWKLIARNPAALLEKRDRPKIERKPVVTIDAPTTAAVLDAARERRLFIPSCWARCAASGVARSRRCAGRRSTLRADSSPSSPRPNNSTPARSVKRKARAARRAPLRFQPSPSKSCAAGGLRRPKSYCGLASVPTIACMS